MAGRRLPGAKWGKTTFKRNNL